MLWLLAVLLAYLIGSFPSGVIVVRLARGIDVRQVGSRRSGTTNVLRAAGAVAAGAVFALDVLKGASAVWLGRWMAGSSLFESLGMRRAFAESPERNTWLAVTAGLAAFCGHNWPVYVRFRGGRGVATAFGSFLALAPFPALGALALGVVVIALTRYVSLGSLIGSCALPVGLALQAVFGSLAWPVVWYGIAAAALIVFQHRDNIARLRAGTERRLGGGASPPGEP
ncbi:MAG: glycerol-3-phosphate 1-O-acyltransferase PlsY [Chloroflexia bacterium]